MQVNGNVDNQLNKENLKNISHISTPSDKLFELPEKVLQFGTGVLLRGLPDYYIDKANKAGIFNGRVVVVKSTTQNKADDFEDQNGLYTLSMRGWQNGQPKAEETINAAISRVIDAVNNWQEVIKCAASPAMKIVLSNTTEVGIVLDKNDQISAIQTPSSFPGKLVSFLYERYRHFKGDPSMGMVIVPTELITDNGRTLKRICLELAEIHQLERAFIQWLDEHNEFCDSLVDRIVSGKMQAAEELAVSEKLGYTDKLMIMSEIYGLWAIQTGKTTAIEALSFAHADAGIIVHATIEKYRHLKLFLLNAPHTFTCVIASALGFKYVTQAMGDAPFEKFIHQLLINELVPAVQNENTTQEEATAFALSVLDRFRNPYIQHQWSDIAKQMSLKMLMRCIPLMKDYQQKFGQLPALMVKGFSAYLLYMKTHKQDDQKYYSTINGITFLVTDAKAAILHEHWQNGNTAQAVRSILQDESLWQTDLTAVPLLEEAVLKAVIDFEQGISLKL